MQVYWWYRGYILLIENHWLCSEGSQKYKTNFLHSWKSNWITAIQGRVSHRNLTILCRQTVMFFNQVHKHSTSFGSKFTVHLRLGWCFLYFFKKLCNKMIWVRPYRLMLSGAKETQHTFLNILLASPLMNCMKLRIPALKNAISLRSAPLMAAN